MRLCPRAVTSGLAIWVAVAVASLYSGAWTSVVLADAEADDGDSWEALLQHVVAVSHPPLNEISGIIRSRTYPDVWWVHNDSGDQARLFAINAQGQVIMPAWRGDKYYAQEFEEGKEPWPGIEVLNSSNVDWEDIAIDGGRLYIADMGNNGNARRDLGIYVVNEPNPAAIDRGARPISFIPVAYPDQDANPPKDWRFDCEAVFFHSGKLYLLTKYRADGRWDKMAYGTSLYRLDTTRTDEVNELTLVSRADDLKIIPTAADLSPDGRRLAVLSYGAVWIFEAADGSDDWLAGKSWKLDLPPHQLKQSEAICWDDDTTLRIANEQRDIFTLDAALLQPVR
jgi:hypothetical protein